MHPKALTTKPLVTSTSMPPSVLTRLSFPLMEEQTARGPRRQVLAAPCLSCSSPSLSLRRAEYWVTNSLSWACRGPPSMLGLSSHCSVCMRTLRNSDEKPVS